MGARVVSHAPLSFRMSRAGVKGSRQPSQSLRPCRVTGKPCLLALDLQDSMKNSSIFQRKLQPDVKFVHSTSLRNKDSQHPIVYATGCSVWRQAGALVCLRPRGWWDHRPAPFVWVGVGGMHGCCCAHRSLPPSWLASAHFAKNGARGWLAKRGVPGAAVWRAHQLQN